MRIGGGRPKLDTAKVKAAEKLDGKFVVITNDDTLSAEDIALGYKGAWIIESCFRRMKQTGLEVRPMFHWTARRIEAHVKLCVLALQMQRAAEIRCQLPWARIAHALGGLKAVRYRCESRTIVQRTKISAELSATLKTLGISASKQILAVEEPPPARRSLGTRPESACRKLLRNQPIYGRLPNDREPRSGAAAGERWNARLARP